MSTKIRESVKKLSHGKELEQALPEYLELALDIHDSHARLKFMMEYYVFYEMITEGINPYINTAEDIAQALHQAVRVLMDPASFGEEERSRQRENLLKLRTEVTDRMQVLTAYVDRFVVYEYILNRMQYRFEDQEVIAEDSVFAQEVLNFIFATKDNMAINDNIRMVIGQLPMLAVYGYQAYSHYHDGKSLYIHMPDPSLSTAENLLHILRPDSKYTNLEAHILDIALVLHMEHGGGNNSTFTPHLVSSSGTDTYSAIAAAIGSLKGPRHGGANIKVVKMFDDMKKQVKDWSNEDEIADYLTKLLHKEGFDHAGLIYGMGHAVYSLSDPRAVIFRSFVEKLSEEKGYEKEFKLYATVERLAPEIIAKERKIYKGVSPNVDFYSGFAYSMLGLPVELYTPIFAIARISGWSAHRLEEVAHSGKIMRPAYKNVGERKAYVPMEER